MICRKGPIFPSSVFQPVDATFFHLLSRHQISRKLSVFQEDNDVNAALTPSAGKFNRKLARRSTTPG